MLLVIVASGYGVEKLLTERQWSPIIEAPEVDGLIVIEALPVPLLLNFPGAAKIWAYQRVDDESVYVVAVFYQSEAQGRELVNSANGVLNRELWRPELEDLQSRELPGRELVLHKAVYRSYQSKKIGVLSHYHFTGLKVTTSDLLAKFYVLRDALLKANGSVKLSVIYTDGLDAKMEYSKFAVEVVNALSPKIERQISRASGAIGS